MIELRATLAGNLPHACVIQVDEGKLVDGAQRSEWYGDTSIPCMLTPLTSSEGFRQDQSSIKATWQVRFEAETPVSESNRLIVTTVDPVSGASVTRTLIVVGILAGRFGEMARMVQARDATPAEL